MKIQTFVVLVTAFFILNSCSETLVINRMTKDDAGNFMMLGRQTNEAFNHEAYSNWYQDEYNNYTTDKTLIKKLKKNIRDYRIVVFFGSWCGDSKREVPRIMKILDELKFPKNQIELYAVNKRKESFFGEEQGKNIAKVPTFIFYKKKKIFGRKHELEVNRIIENPVGESLEADIDKIINNESYTPKYYY